MQHVMNVDLETYSDVDLPKAGVYAYAASPNFEILLIGYCIDDGPVEVIDLTEYRELGMWEDPDERLDNLKAIYPDFAEALRDPRYIKTAYNANFERTGLASFFRCPMPPEQWRCTAVHAATLGLPSTLGGVGEALGLPEDKQKDKIGKSLIKYFCKPCDPTKANGGRTRNFPEHDPEKWRLFIEYNRQDVVTENAIREKLLRYPIPSKEQALWSLDQRMNDRGIGVDMSMVNKILAFDAVYQEQLKEEARRITGLDNPNSLTQLKKWFSSEYGVQVDSLTKDTLPVLMEQLKDKPKAKRMLQIRAEMGKTSTKKYTAMKEAVCPDGRLRGILQFYGANRTGRWAGRIVQVHNLPQNKIPDIDLARELAAEGDFETIQNFYEEGIPFIFSQLIRTALIPSKGCTFVVADFSAIEARVIAWLAGEHWVLEAFKAGKDIYCETASMMYHVPVVKHGQNGELRQKGKIATLACGYGGSIGAMKAMDKAGTIPEDEIQSVVDHWRQANPNIVRLWRDYEAAAKTAISERRKVTRGIRVQADNLAEREYMAGGDHVRKYSVRQDAPPVVFEWKDKNLFIQLPSGRKLCYFDVSIEDDDQKGKELITYAGTEQATKKWGRLKTWGGKIVENVVQAVARDCLAETLLRTDAAGYNIVMHVHDELICDVPDGCDHDLQKILDIMKTPISWAPGLPLKGDGYITDFYKKD